jgi:aspartate aminotransferase-like enzyme
MADVREKLKTVFQTKNEILVLTSSGTGAMEGVMSSCLKKGDKVLVVDGGKFGERFAKIAKAYGLEADVISVDWGKPVTLEQIKSKLTKDHAALCIQASETSTGTVHPIKEIMEILNKDFPDCLSIVDGITAVGCADIQTDAWGIDIMLSGSQKAFMIPPGLGFASLSEKAIKRMESSDLPHFYLSFKAELKAIKENQTAYTPNTAHVVALQEALNMMLEEGMDNLYKRHERIAKATRTALAKMGLKLASTAPTVACSAAFLPEGVDGKALLKKIRSDYGFTIAGGQNDWAGKVVRVSHLGYYSPFDLMSCLTAMGRTMEKEGVKVDTLGALQSFMDTYEL